MLAALLVVVLLALSTEAAPAPADYPVPLSPSRDVLSWNQSQNGKVNLQVSLKDVQIFALLNSDLYDDDNNADYDYEELVALLNNQTNQAIKPPDSEESGEDTSAGVTEEQPLLSLAEVLEVAAAQEDSKNKNGTQVVAAPLVPFVANGKPENISQLPNDPAKRSGLPRPELYQRERPASSTPKPPCAQGFARDRLGRCRRVKSTTKRRRPASLTFPLKLSLQGLAKGFRLARLPSDDDWE